MEKARESLNGLAKSFRFVMSHPTGKIEMIGFIPEGNENDKMRMIFKYNQAKASEDLGRIFIQDIDEGQTWLD